MNLLSISKDLPKDYIPVSFYVKCPKVDKEIPLSECEQCEYHRGFIQSREPYGVFCSFLKK